MPIPVATETTEITMANLVPIKCSLKFRPPTLIIFYDDLNKPKKKRRRRSIPLRDFNPKTNVLLYATDSLYNCKRHKDYVSKIKRQQIVSLLERIQQAQLHGLTELSTPLQATMEGTSSTSTTVVPPTRVAMDTTTLTNLSDLPSLTAKPPSRQTTAEQILSLDIDEILNSTSTNSNTHDNVANVTAARDNTSEKSKTKPTEKKKDDIISLLVDSSPTVTAGNGKPGRLPTTSLPAPDLRGLDDNYGNDFEPLSPEVLPKKYNDVDYTLSNENLSALSEEIATTDSTSCLDDLPEGGLKIDRPLLSNELIDNIITSEDSISSAGEVDYNKMTETNYQQRKAEMEKEFKQKQLKPGDPGYVYNKEVEFEPAKVESGWDTDTDEDVSEF